MTATLAMPASDIDLQTTPAWQELATVIYRLDMISHAPTQSIGGTGSASSDDDIGGRRPRGGIDDDHRRDYEHGSAPDLVMLRSADYFRRRARGCRTVKHLEDVLADARRTLETWQRAPRPTNPEWGSWAWKRQVADDIDTGRRTRGEAMKHYSISRTTLWRILKRYGAKETYTR